ncbi:flagellar assembly protein FliW [Nitrospira moscoviensis]|uniref:Flagellar assembly factor FliW n=1 Tax=Nitrospira moscoviensis TaxID=42253 RepID=A0A0K2GCA7_NITMO|nr:flagellar assembly protein FliW [Nitrospira moscoviensis]ALA58590.1 Flagellar assembly factor FliW [Nitrospira moscoviensis]
MKCTSSRFGSFEIDDKSILAFPSGLLGFPDHRRYVMLDHDTDAPFKWLQSLDEPALAFVVIDPALFHTDYRVTYSPEALEEVGSMEADELTLAVILTIPSDDPGRITANLRGPLLMNPRTNLCKQLVLSDDYPTRYPLFPVESLESGSNPQPVPTVACPA